MPRRIFKKFAFKRHEISDKWFLSPFRHLLHDHRLWGIRRKTVVPAFSLGLFIAFMPFPGHALLAALLALAMRINIPVATVATFLTNPVTMGPIYYFCYRIGNDLLAKPERPFNFELSLNWVTHQFLSNWQPVLLGCVLVGLITAIIGFVSLDAMWRYSLADYKARKRSKRPRR